MFRIIIYRKNYIGFTSSDTLEISENSQFNNALIFLGKNLKPTDVTIEGNYFERRICIQIIKKKINKAHCSEFYVVSNECDGPNPKL